MSQINANAILDASGGTTASINGYTPSASNMTGRNRIINGAMMIDQRNAGASVNTDGAFAVDRFNDRMAGGGVITQQQSTTVPAGFINSLSATVSTNDSSIAASDFYILQHHIEGVNVSDLGFGTANASTVTLSFWVRASITGTYAGSLLNSAANRSYVYTYTISAADTWEKKSITIAGDTSGTWLTNNGIGLRITWDLGSGSDFQATAGVWGSTYSSRTSGSTNWISTNGATFYITGVQLEVGSTASEFEHRQYGQELALCQRYLNTSYIYGTAIGTITTTGCVGRYSDAAGGYYNCNTVSYPVTMRTNASVTIWGVLSGATSGQVSGDTVNKNGGVFFTGSRGFGAGVNNVSSYSGESVRFHYKAESEL